MKQLLILSGKGGTGKTTIASAFIRLAEARACADCDVDAPNLHLVMEQKAEPRLTDYYGMPKAEIDSDSCVGCDLCREHCRFGAISANGDYKVDAFACEGCGVCEEICPHNAITLRPAVAGELKLYADEAVFSTAQLKMGSGTSGLLVTEVKKQLQSEVSSSELAIIDGSPGIGCPVIASLSGVDMVLIVTEPSLSGLSDMERILRTAAHFGVKAAVCINKYDSNRVIAEKIEDYCRQEGLPMTGRIPFDNQAVRAVNDGHSIVDIDCEAGRAAEKVYETTMEIFNRQGDGEDEQSHRE